MDEKIKNIILVGVLAWAITATSLAAYYFNEYDNIKRLYESLSKKLIVVNIGIDYGNGTISWFNGTLLPAGIDLLSATASIAKIEYTHGIYGAYVTSINGVEEKILSPKEGYSWFWFVYNATTGTFEYGLTAADRHVLSNGEIVLWKYVHWRF